MTSIPLVYSFWFMLAAYVVHIIDESLLGGSFVEKVQQHWWRQYSWRKFFWFNAAYLTMMTASIVLYDRIGSRLASFLWDGRSRGSSMPSGTSGGPCTAKSIRPGS